MPKFRDHELLKTIMPWTYDTVLPPPLPPPPRGGGGGGGYFTKLLVRSPALGEKWIQSNLWFCQNEGPKRSKNNENGAQQDRKSRRNLVQNDLKQSNDRCWWNITPTLGRIIFGTKWERDNPICSAGRGGQ